MKRQYQIEKQRAVQQFRRIATEHNPSIQMILPLAEIVGLLQEGVGNLLRHAGLELMHLVMDEEVKSLAGDRHQQHEGRRAHRWGEEDGYCVVDGQKVPIRKTRLRTPDKREQRLGSYELFQRSGPMQLGVWARIAGDAFAGGTESAGGVLIWSPDGRFLAFDSGGKLLKMDISGGFRRTLCNLDRV